MYTRHAQSCAGFKNGRVPATHEQPCEPFGPIGSCAHVSRPKRGAVAGAQQVRSPEVPTADAMFKKKLAGSSGTGGGGIAASIKRVTSHLGKTGSKFAFALALERAYGLGRGAYVIRLTRGGKSVETDASIQSSGGYSCVVSQTLALESTLYKADFSGNTSVAPTFDDKVYKLSVYQVKDASGSVVNRCVGKTDINMVEFAGVPSKETVKTFKLSDKLTVKGTVKCTFLGTDVKGSASVAASSVSAGSGSLMDTDSIGAEGLADLDDLDDLLEPEEKAAFEKRTMSSASSKANLKTAKVGVQENVSKPKPVGPLAALKTAMSPKGAGASPRGDLRSSFSSLASQSKAAVGATPSTSSAVVQSGKHQGKKAHIFSFTIKFLTGTGLKRGGTYFFRLIQGHKEASCDAFKVGADSNAVLTLDSLLVLQATLFQDEATRLFEHKQCKLLVIRVTDEKEKIVGKVYFNIASFAAFPHKTEQTRFSLSENIWCEAEITGTFTSFAVSAMSRNAALGDGALDAGRNSPDTMSLASEELAADALESLDDLEEILGPHDDEDNSDVVKLRKNVPPKRAAFGAVAPAQESSRRGSSTRTPAKQAGQEKGSFPERDGSSRGEALLPSQVLAPAGATIVHSEQSNLAQAKRDLDAARARIAELEALCTRLHSDVKRVEDENEEIRDRLKRTESRHSDEISKISKDAQLFMKQRDEYAAKYSQAQSAEKKIAQTYADQEIELEVLKKETERLRKDHASSQDMLQQAALRTDAASKALETRFQSDMEAKDEQINDLKERIAGLEAESEAAQKQLALVHVSHKQELSALEEENKALEARLNEAQTGLDELDIARTSIQKVEADLLFKSNELEKLADQMQMQKATFEAAQQEAHELQVALDAEHAERTACEVRLAQQSEQMRTSEEEKENLGVQLSELQKIVGENEAVIASKREADAEMLSKSDDSGGLSEEIQSLKSVLEAVEQDKNDLKLALDEMQGEISALEAHVAQKNEQITALQEEKESLNVQLIDAQNSLGEHDAILASKRELEAEMLSKSDDYQRLADEVQKHKCALEAVEHEKNSLKLSLDEVQAEVSVLQSHVEKQSIEFRESAEQADRYKDDSAERSRCIEVMAVELDKLRDENVSLALIVAERDALQTQIGEAADREAALAAQVAHVGREKEDLSERLSSDTQPNVAMKEQWEEEARARAHLEEQLSKTSERLDELETKLALSEKLNEELKQSLAAEKDLCVAAQSEREARDRTVSGLEVQLADASARLSGLEAQLEKSTRENVDLANAVSSANSEIGRVQELLRSTEQRIAGLEEQIAGLQDEKRTLIESLEEEKRCSEENAIGKASEEQRRKEKEEELALNVAKVASLGAQITTLNLTVNELESRNARLSSDLERVDSSSRSAVGAVEDQRRDVERQAAKYETKTKELEARLKALENEHKTALSGLEESLAASRVHVVELEKEAVRLKADKSEAEQSMEELELRHVEVQSQNKQVAREHEEFRNEMQLKVRNMERERELLQKDLEEARCLDRDSSKNEATTARASEMEAQRNRLDELEDMLSARERDYRQAKQDLKNLESERDVLQREKESVSVRLTREIDALRVEKGDLERELDRLERMVDDSERARLSGDAHGTDRRTLENDGESLSLEEILVLLTETKVALALAQEENVKLRNTKKKGWF
ncbi:hypothetical protein FVE85_9454 [Porphyridium purpureum]|uniref:C2 NT-type domain-containing protein n=1 Tax=Porphyridium purpureum TaxID=35688 RepID=A0A5J4YIE6_PORPP|nr:hypothetical protein FVE85_9454 [Porphyridium purpureum]|eukprot:POR1557..scf261_15